MVVKSVPPGVTVVGIPGRAVQDSHDPQADLEHGQLPDPVAEAIRLVLKEQDKLEGRLQQLEGLSGLIPPEDDLIEEKREIVKEFNEGGGI